MYIYETVNKYTAHTQVEQLMCKIVFHCSMLGLHTFVIAHVNKPPHGVAADKIKEKILFYFSNHCSRFITTVT